MKQQHTEKAAPERELVEAALAALGKFGVQARLEEMEPALGKGRADALVRLDFGGQAILYAAQVKRRITPGTLGHVVAQLRDGGAATLLITDYLTPQVAEKLRELDLPFLDAAGNAYIHRPPAFIWVTGRKPHAAITPRAARVTRAFQATGLKLVFAFLCRPDLVNAPYREMVNYAGVAQGTVGWVLADLMAAGFVVDLEKHGRKLRHGKRLLDAWAEAYARTLRPKLVLGTYRAPDRNGWETLDAKRYGALLGGEPAAARVTEFLRPGTATLYTEKVPALLIADLRLRADPDGEVEILRRFWPFNFTWEFPDLAPPVLIYADLLATGDARCIETAKRLYDRYLHGPLGNL